MTPEDPTDLLRAPEERLLEPGFRARPDALHHLLEDGFRGIGASGRPWTRDGIVEALQEAPGFDRPRRIAELELRLLAEGVAPVTYLAPDPPTRRRSVWRLGDGWWRMAFHRGTPAPGA